MTPAPDHAITHNERVVPIIYMGGTDEMFLFVARNLNLLVLTFDGN